MSALLGASKTTQADDAATRARTGDGGEPHGMWRAQGDRMAGGPEGYPLGGPEGYPLEGVPKGTSSRRTTRDSTEDECNGATVTYKYSFEFL